MNLARVLNFSAIESIGSRLFDFITLWIVLNTLPIDDLAKFGLATSSIFIFNSFLLTPETALFRYQKKWIDSGKITKYLSAFISFSVFKILLHYIFAFLVYIYTGQMSWLFYAIIFSAVAQKIQGAEIVRIVMRMELQQKRVALFELKSKLVLTAFSLVLFYESNIEAYLLIYFFWSFSVLLIWLYQLRKTYLFFFDLTKKSWLFVWQALKGFSIWTHFSGVATFFIYNSSLLFLGWFAFSAKDVALYTVVNKVANFFFVVPMFLQSIVPVILSNAGKYQNQKFNRLFFISSGISFVQLFFFYFLGEFLGSLFGLDEPELVTMFYQHGLIISLGIFLLNITRPFSTYLFIKISPMKVMLKIFIPTVVLAFFLYPMSLHYYGLEGISYAIAIVYGFLALLLAIHYLKQKRIRL